MSDARPKRILIYSHDTYGLGHLRRNLLIAGGIARAHPDWAVLIATGSPWTHAFGVPPGCDTLKLPCVTKQADGSYVPVRLGLALDEVIRLRTSILMEVVRSFRPHVFLVDHAPVGVGGELAPVLARLRRARRRPRIVLGLREIVDDAERVRRDWDRHGVWRELEESYDRILVYGDERVLTTARELGLERRYADKLTYTGYVARQIPARSRPAVPEILVMAGGGADGAGMLNGWVSYLESRTTPAPFRSVIVTGPFAEPADLTSIRERLARIAHPAEIFTFHDRVDELLSRASAVVSMAGYNSVTEILAAGVPALLVPRERPRVEQLLRAERLAAFSAVECCREAQYGPDTIGAFVERALSHPDRIPATVGLDGVARTVAALDSVRSQGSSISRRIARVM